LLKSASIPIERCPVSHQDFASLINSITRGSITEMTARTVLEEMFRSGEPPESIISAKGLEAIKDGDVLGKTVDEVMAENPGPVSQILGGKREVLKFLIGQVMKKTRGKADPRQVKEFLERRLGTLG